MFNNQFKGPNAWDNYLTSLEQATPTIRAIAVTDYYCTDTYQHVVREKEENGRLPQVALIFPNVELRLDIATVKERWTNIHLLVCPGDPDHVVEVERFLSRLRFEAFGDNFACTREDLAKLGRKSKPELTDERAAFRHGASQFKVNFGKLREEFGRSGWAKENILIAVAGAETDGTSGIRDSNDATLRQEIEKFSHVIFASSPAQRDFWLGRKSGVGEDVLRERYMTVASPASMAAMPMSRPPSPSPMATAIPGSRARWNSMRCAKHISILPVARLSAPIRLSERRPPAS